MHWRVQGSMSSPTGIGSRRRVIVYAILSVLIYTQPRMTSKLHLDNTDCVTNNTCCVMLPVYTRYACMSTGLQHYELEMVVRKQY